MLRDLPISFGTSGSTVKSSTGEDQRWILHETYPSIVLTERGTRGRPTKELGRLVREEGSGENIHILRL